jgi:hypothetical protein
MGMKCEPHKTQISGKGFELLDNKAPHTAPAELRKYSDSREDAMLGLESNQSTCGDSLVTDIAERMKGRII